MREYPVLPSPYATALREAVDFVFARFDALQVPTGFFEWESESEALS